MLLFHLAKSTENITEAPKQKPDDGKLRTLCGT